MKLKLKYFNQSCCLLQQKAQNHKRFPRRLEMDSMCKLEGSEECKFITISQWQIQEFSIGEGCKHFLRRKAAVSGCTHTVRCPICDKIGGPPLSLQK